MPNLKDINVFTMYKGQGKDSGCAIRSILLSIDDTWKHYPTSAEAKRHVTDYIAWVIDVEPRFYEAIHHHMTKDSKPAGYFDIALSMPYLRTAIKANQGTIHGCKI